MNFISVIIATAPDMSLSDVIMIRQVMQNIIEESDVCIQSPIEQNRDLTETILSDVSKLYGVDVFDIKRRSRKNEYLHPRQLAIFLLKRLTEMSLQSIGSIVNIANHATVIHSVRQICDRHFTDSEFRKKINPIVLKYDLLKSDFECNIKKAR